MHVLQSCGPIGGNLEDALHAILPPLLAGLLDGARELLLLVPAWLVCTSLR
jgi:hypothetical protein